MAHSTETALLRVTNDMLCTIDNPKESVALLLLDLLSAFDTVNHNVLISRLKTSFGLSSTVINWFKSYLSNRKQNVIIDNSLSKQLSAINTGVPQGRPTLILKVLAVIIRKSLFQSDTEKLVHAFISSRLDNCNSLLAGLPAYKPLIRVQNAAARLVTRTRSYY
ncbi:uncharacterized protein LOC117118706 [Anneissia japonica]|uniref:uncharacterized protein LOC117118706 n=1 Tax=Anneissia japonica TaxID=1529436 RepID=UPI001425B643|nr:uncharacterized protein LOC117118706 [Anneissia japonica]